jgi:hypothetical protein
VLGPEGNKRGSVENAHGGLFLYHAPTLGARRFSVAPLAGPKVPSSLAGARHAQVYVVCLRRSTTDGGDQP